MQEVTGSSPAFSTKVKSDNIGLFPFIDKEGCVMSRIKAFRFSWCDAWRRIDEGYDSILETSEKGDVVKIGRAHV